MAALAPLEDIANRKIQRLTTSGYVWDVYLQL